MRKQRSNDVKGIAEGHIGTFAEEMVPSIGTTVDHSFLSITLPSLIGLDSPLVREGPIVTTRAPQGAFCLGVFTDVLYLEITAGVIKQELLWQLPT